MKGHRARDLKKVGEALRRMLSNGDVAFQLQTAKDSDKLNEHEHELYQRFLTRWIAEAEEMSKCGEEKSK